MRSDTKAIILHTFVGKVVNMTKKLLYKRVQNQAYQLVIRQLAGVFLLATAALYFGRHQAFSVLAGGLAYGLPNLFFVWRVFRYAGASEMHKFIAAFFIGEMLKLFLSGILFIFIVNYLQVSLLSALIGFAGAIISFWIVCIVHFSRDK